MTYQDDGRGTTPIAADGPKGIGGWMILPILGLFGTLALTLYNMAQVFVQWHGMELIIEGSNDRLVALRLPTAISLVDGMSIVVLVPLCLYRIFTYSPAVPKLMTIFYVWLILSAFGESYADHAINDILGTPSTEGIFTSDLAHALVGAAIWIPYFWRSRRVANTFGLAEARTRKQVGEIFS